MTKVIGVIVAVAAFVLVEFSGAAAVAQQSPWQVRLRTIAFAPDVMSNTKAIGGDIDFDNDYIPELDFTYFFTKHFAAELILATSRHSVNTANSTVGNLDLGRVSALPPVLTVQYHFLPEQRYRPYIGAGVNYTFFYDESAPRKTVNSINYENTFAWAIQAGIDVGIHGNWFVNFDVKKVFLNTDVAINDNTIIADVDLNPWVVGFGVGYRF